MSLDRINNIDVYDHNHINDHHDDGGDDDDYVYDDGVAVDIDKQNNV